MLMLLAEDEVDEGNADEGRHQGNPHQDDEPPAALLVYGMRLVHGHGLPVEGQVCLTLIRGHGTEGTHVVSFLHAVVHALGAALKALTSHDSLLVRVLTLR